MPAAVVNSTRFCTAQILEEAGSESCITLDYLNEIVREEALRGFVVYFGGYLGL